MALLLFANTAMASQLVLSWDKEYLEFKPDPGTKVITGSFRFTNLSQEPLTFSRVTPSCGCLKIASFPKETPAGESGVVEFRYEAEGKEGVQTAGIEIQPNGATRSLQTLRMKLELSPRVTIRPGLLIWDKSTTSKEVSIVVIDPALTLDQNIKITGDFAATLVPSEKKGEFRLQLQRPAKPGRAEGWVTLSFNDGSNKSMERKIRLIAD